MGEVLGADPPRHRSTADVRGKGASVASSPKIGWFVERMAIALADARWLAGTDYSLADIAAYPMIEGAGRLYPEALAGPAAAPIRDWLARIGARPAVQAAFATSRFANAPGQARDAEARAGEPEPSRPGTLRS